MERWCGTNVLPGVASPRFDSVFPGLASREISRSHCHFTMSSTFIPAPLRSFQADKLRVHVFASNDDMSVAVAAHVHAYLLETLERQGSAAVILATGNSQIRFLKRLVDAGRLDWSKITLFHLDEYLGIRADNPACFRHYLRERVESLVKPKVFHYIEGDADLPLDECARYTSLLKAQPIDLVCLGVGENGHLAFNDPPVARFDDPHWIKLVKLDEECKMQQVREGHFPSLEAVPPYAFTLTIPALCAPRKMVCVAPEKRKAVPIKNALQGPVSISCPASFLRQQSHCDLLLDVDSASLL
jgi:glucosamine-6-phosphate deaminase